MVEVTSPRPRRCGCPTGPDGAIRVISNQESFAALLEWAFDKIRHASVGTPAVMIRQLEALTTIMGQTTDPEHARAVMDQATLISRASAESLME